MRTRVPAVLLVLLLGLGAFSCRKASTAPSPSDPPPASQSVTLSGTVTDASSGAALASVTVAGGGKTATTAADGRYSLTDLAAGAVTLTTQRQGYRNGSQTVNVTVGANSQNVMMTPAIAAGFQGNWTGSWTNMTFGTTGPAVATVTSDTIAQSIRIVLDLGGGVFGGGDPPAETFTLAYTLAGGSFTATSPTYGTVNLTGSPTGAISGSLTNLPSPAIARVDYTGTITPQSFTATFTIQFAGGGTAGSTLTMSKEGGASTLSVLAAQLKARVRTFLSSPSRFASLR